MESLRGTIITWDQQKGYGYVQSGEQRVFLHIRDFAERHKYPEIGDVIVFSLGTDPKGRTCAKHAVHLNDGGRLRPVHLAIVTALLIAPGLAAWRLAQGRGVMFLLGCYVAASGLTYLLYSDDKHRARHRNWRAPERALHCFEMAGGWPGAFLAQRRLRHKCTKLSFQLLFWFIVGAHQFVAIDYLLDWRLTRATVRKVRAVGVGLPAS